MLPAGAGAGSAPRQPTGVCMPDRFISISNVDGIRVVALRLPRVVDLYEFDRINAAIARVTDKDAGDGWILDMQAVEYVGSAILGLMVNLRQRIKAGGGRLVVCGMTDGIVQALKTCSLFNLFSIAKTRDDAVRLANSLR
jgi:anti-anti-sigma factor